MTDYFLSTAKRNADMFKKCLCVVVGESLYCIENLACLTQLKAKSKLAIKITSIGNYLLGTIITQQPYLPIQNKKMKYDHQFERQQSIFASFCF